MKAKYLFTGLAVTSLIVASCNNKSSDSATTEASASESLVEPTTAIAKELSGKAHIMVAGEYKETQIKDSPYYIFYFTASW